MGIGHCSKLLQLVGPLPVALPETNIFAPGNGWLEYKPFLLGWPIFRGELLVSGTV